MSLLFKLLTISFWFLTLASTAPAYSFVGVGPQIVKLKYKRQAFAPDWLVNVAGVDNGNQQPIGPDFCINGSVTFGWGSTPKSTLSNAKTLTCTQNTMASSLLKIYFDETSGLNNWFDSKAPIVNDNNPPCIMVKTRSGVAEPYICTDTTDLSASNATCKVTSPDINFDFGTLDATRNFNLIEGKPITEHVTLRCSGLNGSRNVNFLIKGQNGTTSSEIPLAAKGSLKGSLTAEMIIGRKGQDLSHGTYFENGEDEILLTAVLHVHGQVLTAGNYKGTGILLMTLQ